MKILMRFEKQNSAHLVLIGYGLIVLIGFVDYLTGSELAFSVFYVLPLALITWVTNSKTGLITSLVCAITWLVADMATGQSYSSALVPIWNTLIRLTFYVIITLLLSSLKDILKLAHTDPLTSAANFRHLRVIAQMEIDRVQRYQHPFTVAYLDLDDFKAVNDELGHAIGDRVLCTLVNAIRASVRKSDFVARLGGDEFIVLFPETDETAAQMICTKLQKAFLEEMDKNNWPVTFSIGVLTCKATPKTADELIRMADNLMYRAKSLGKNTVQYATYVG